MIRERRERGERGRMKECQGERKRARSHTFIHFWKDAKCLFFRQCNWKRLLQYLMKCLCCGTWTHPQLHWTVASQVGHYCSHLQRARASLCPQWCQASGICCKTAGDSGREAALLLTYREDRVQGEKQAAEKKKNTTATKKKKKNLQHNIIT